MTTVPAAAAAVFAGDDRRLRDACAAAGVRLGNRVEVDLAVLAAVGQTADAGRMEDWWQANVRLWAAAAAGDPSGFAWVRTRRRVVQARQVTAKAARTDLVDHYTALAELPGVSDLIAEATAISPATAAVRALAGAAGGTFTRASSQDSATLTFTLTGSLLYPDCLGGPVWPGEIGRTVTLELRYAAWRDRRVRRLAAVMVDVDELWVDPADYR